MMVSIIVPVYNVSEYISDCLVSIISQTYSDIECILVDDKSPDDSIEICNHIISSYSGSINFKIIHHETNRGLSAARNTGLNHARGEYVFFVDSDDWISPDCIEKMMSCVYEHPDVEIVFSGAVSVPDVGEYDWMSLSNKQLPGYSNNPKWIKISMLQRYTLSMTAWNRLVKRSFIIDNDLIFFEGNTHEDELWNFNLAKYASEIAISNSNTYFYRIRNDGIIRKEDINKRVSSLLGIWSEMRDTIDSFLPEVQAKSIWRHIAESYYDQNLSTELHNSERAILFAVRKYLTLSGKVILTLYAKHKKTFVILTKVPKVRGYINIKMNIHNNSPEIIYK